MLATSYTIKRVSTFSCRANASYHHQKYSQQAITSITSEYCSVGGGRAVYESIEVNKPAVWSLTLLVVTKSISLMAKRF